jgi:hypothetical protein
MFKHLAFCWFRNRAILRQLQESSQRVSRGVAGAESATPHEVAMRRRLTSLFCFVPIRRRLRAITNDDSEHGHKQTELPRKTGEDRNDKE